MSSQQARAEPVVRTTTMPVESVGKLFESGPHSHRTLHHSTPQLQLYLYYVFHFLIMDQ